MKRGLPLMACLKASLAFVPKAYAHAWAGLLLGALPFALLLARPVFDALNSFSVRPYQLALAVVGASATALVRDGGLYRLGVSDTPGAARERGLGPAGLQFGKPEIRLLAASLLVFLFMLLIAIAGLVVTLFVASAAGLSEVNWATVSSAAAYLELGEPWKLAVVATVAALSLAVLASLGAKLSLYAAATVGRGRVSSLDALALAEGSGLKLLVGLMVVHLPVIVLYAVTPWLRELGFMVAPVAEVVVVALVQAPLTAGFLSACYRSLEYVNAQDIGGEVHG